MYTKVKGQYSSARKEGSFQSGNYKVLRGSLKECLVPKSEVLNPKSEVSNFKSEFLNLKSEV